jgi:hypothetical protein
VKGCRVARLRDSTSQEACARRARIFALTTGCDMLMYRRLVGCGARRKDRNTRLLESFRRLEREGAFMCWTCACWKIYINVLGLICSMAGLALQETSVGEILLLPLCPTYYSRSLTTPGVWLLRQLLSLKMLFHSVFE